MDYTKNVDCEANRKAVHGLEKPKRLKPTSGTADQFQRRMGLTPPTRKKGLFVPALRSPQHKRLTNTIISGTFPLVPNVGKEV